MRVEMVSGVFLAIVILLTFNGSSGMSAGNDTYIIDVTPDEVLKHILHAYKIDFDAPSFLARGDVLFQLSNTNWYVDLSQKPTVYGDFSYSDSEQTVAHKFAAEVGVEAYYGAFSAAASMATSKSTDRSIKTVRIDSFIRAIKYELSAKNLFNTNPEKFLTTNFKKAVKRLKVEEIEDLIGIFYAKRMQLGGEVKKSYTMQAMEQDNEKSVSTEVRTGFGGVMFGASAKANVGVSSRLNNKNSEMKISWAAKGGDTTIWLGVTFNKTSMEKIQGDWAKSIVDDNLYPFNYKLAPMWDLVKSVDEEKGAEFEQYLVNKWKEALKDFVPTRFLPGDCVDKSPNCRGLYLLEYCALGKYVKKLRGVCDASCRFCEVVCKEGNSCTRKVGMRNVLPAGSQLVSNNGKTKLVMQHDGNLVLYCTVDGRRLWESRTYWSGVDSGLKIQYDGNMVLSNGDKVVWSSNTDHNHQQVVLKVQDDNNVALYAHDPEFNDVLWATHTEHSWC